MKKYYIIINDKQEGPFTTEIIKSLKLSGETLVWSKGMKNWAKVQDVDKSLCVQIKKVEDVDKQLSTQIEKVEALNQYGEDNQVKDKFNIYYKLLFVFSIIFVLYFTFFHNDGFQKEKKINYNITYDDFKNKIFKARIIHKGFNDYPDTESWEYYIFTKDTMWYTANGDGDLNKKVKNIIWFEKHSDRISKLSSKEFESHYESPVCFLETVRNDSIVFRDGSANELYVFGLTRKGDKIIIHGNSRIDELYFYKNLYDFDKGKGVSFTKRQIKN